MVWYYTIKRTHSGTNNKNSLVALKKLCKKIFLKCSVQPFHCFAGKSFFAIPQKRTWKLLLSWSGRYWLLIKRVDTGILPRWRFKHCEVAIFVQFSMETVKKKKKKVIMKNYPVCQTLAQDGCRSWRTCEHCSDDAGRYLLQAYALMFLMT